MGKIEDLRRVVFFSGGIGSWAAAKRVVQEHGAKDTILLFNDTKMEDPDLYRFLGEAAENVSARLVRIADGRTPWGVFFDERFLGNTRADPCSKILKRQLSRTWVEKHFPDPAAVVLYVGIDWTEAHRLEALTRNWAPYTVEAPMMKPPYLDKTQMLQQLQDEGVTPPRLYELGFPHNNCGGFCVKAGQAHFAHLLKMLPEVYAHHEQMEQELRDYLNKDVSVLRDRRGGITRPMTLREFRLRLELETASLDRDGWGGCGCFGGE